jgi:UDP-4-amino-4,6-dideoxy-N-acetyl-beta-L-altrosamine transaminase
MIPYSRQKITRQDIRSVTKTLKSKFLAQGPKTSEFEVDFTQVTGAKYAIATNSATSALHIACLALGVSPGDRVWTSANSFVASANCILYCGAQVDFVDIDPLTFNMSVEALEHKLEESLKNGSLPKVLIPVHFGGQSCEMNKIYELSIKFNFKIIEDASHALGASYCGNQVGNCNFSDISIFSFHPVKIITTGEGGMATTNDTELACRMRLLRSHGIERNKSNFEIRSENEIWNYQQIILGYNYRMSEINASLGISQLLKLDQFVTERNKIASRYDNLISEMGLVSQKIMENVKSSFHLYPIRVNKSKFGKNQSEVYQKLIKSGIEANVHYIPIHRHPYFEKLGFQEGDYPEAEKFFREVISLPIFPGLRKNQQNFIVKILGKIKEE